MLSAALLAESRLHAPPRGLPWQVFSRDWLGERGIDYGDWLRQSDTFLRLGECLALSMGYPTRDLDYDVHLEWRAANSLAATRMKPLEAAQILGEFGVPPVFCQIEDAGSWDVASPSVAAAVLEEFWLESEGRADPVGYLKHRIQDYSGARGRWSLDDEVASYYEWVGRYRLFIGPTDMRAISGADWIVRRTRVRDSEGRLPSAD